jgi:hypothetical protein
MAYPTVSAPYGFKPVNRQDGMAYAGATTQYVVASSNAAIYNGDLVYISNGQIAKSAVTSDATFGSNLTAGVFVGCQYVNTQGQTVQSQFYPGNAAASSPIAYVVVDANAAFKVAVVSGGTPTGNLSSTTLGAIGVNVQVEQGAGSATTGNSGLAIVAPTSGSGSNVALPAKVIAVVPETAINATNFREVLVVLTNPQLTRAAGNDFA